MNLPASESTAEAAESHLTSRSHSSPSVPPATVVHSIEVAVKVSLSTVHSTPQSLTVVVSFLEVSKRFPSILSLTLPSVPMPVDENVSMIAFAVGAVKMNLPASESTAEAAESHLTSRSHSCPSVPPATVVHSIEVAVKVSLSTVHSTPQSLTV